MIGRRLELAGKVPADLISMSLFRRRLNRFQPPNQRSAGDLDNEILARMTVHPLAQPRLPVGGDQPRIKKLRHQVVQVVIRLQDDIAAATAVPAAGAAFGAGSFPEKGDAAFAPVPGPRVNCYFINEHDGVSQQKRRG